MMNCNYHRFLHLLGFVVYIIADIDPKTGSAFITLPIYIISKFMAIFSLYLHS